MEFPFCSIERLFCVWEQVAIGSGLGPFTGTVREAQLGLDLPNVRTIDAKGLPLVRDHIHLTTPAQVRLGQMLADAFLRFMPHAASLASKASTRASACDIFIIPYLSRPNPKLSDTKTQKLNRDLSKPDGDSQILVQYKDPPKTTPIQSLHHPCEPKIQALQPPPPPLLTTSLKSKNVGSRAEMPHHGEEVAAKAQIARLRHIFWHILLQRLW
ncbi:hypothetical protein NL676_025900 [Syzygium grande]|nr:hypothetical protein NL676_025900 [Syzygium grande]